MGMSLLVVCAVGSIVLYVSGVVVLSMKWIAMAVSIQAPRSSSGWLMLALLLVARVVCGG